MAEGNLHRLRRARYAERPRHHILLLLITLLLFIIRGSDAQDCLQTLEWKEKKDCPCDNACSRCALDVPYGEACWLDFTTETKRRQVIDLYIPHGQSDDSPLLIWAHGVGHNRSMEVHGLVGAKLLLPALRSGFIVAAVESRHPLLDFGLDGKAPTTDITQAVQFLRCLKKLKFSRGKVGVALHSRGSTGLWTAVQDDYASSSQVWEDSDILQQSSNVQAVWAVDASASFWPDWIITRSGWYDVAAEVVIPFRYFSMLMIGSNKGHALADITKDDPPIQLMYTSTLPADPSIAYTVQDLDVGLGNPHFNPRHGAAICKAYKKAFGDSKQCNVRYDVDLKRVYDGAVNFFRNHMKVAAKVDPLLPSTDDTGGKTVVVDLDANECPVILWDETRILYVCVALVSLALVVSFFVWLWCRDPPRRKRGSDEDEWCGCVDRTDAYADVERASVFRPCRESGCNMARLPGMKWCIVHGGVTTYRRVQLIDT